MSRPISQWKEEYWDCERQRLGVDKEQVNENQYLFNLRRYFERIYNKEEEYSKDLVEMSRDEAIDTLSSAKIKSSATRGSFLSMMKKYGRWLVHHGKVDSCETLESITPSNIINTQLILESMIKNPEHLEEIIKIGLSNVNGESRQVVAELIIRLLYMGIKVVELCELKKNSMDEYGKVVIETGEYQLDDAIRGLWLKCVQLFEFESASQYDWPLQHDWPLVENDYLFRFVVREKNNEVIYENKPCSKSFFDKFVNDVFEGYSMKTKNHVKASVSEIRKSGLSYKMLLDERSGVELTNKHVLDTFKKPYNKNKTNSELRAKTHNLREDYYDWKIAFQHNVIEGDADE